MRRKTFLGALGAGAVANAAQEGASAGVERQRRPFQVWIANLVDNLDSKLDPESRRAVMESCGRACARRSSVAQAARGGVDGLVAVLAKHLGAENASRHGGTVRLRYTKCYCPLVADGPERLSGTWCECSRGWVLELFQAAAGKPVEVELLSSIKRGDPNCDFVVRL